MSLFTTRYVLPTEETIISAKVQYIKKLSISIYSLEFRAVFCRLVDKSDPYIFSLILLTLFPKII